MENKTLEFLEPPFSRFLFANTKMAWLWLIVRVYVGWQWLEAGWAKVTGTGWTDGSSGAALKGFLAGAMQKTAGAHPDVQGWYAHFLQNFVIPHAGFFAQLVAYGELFVGIGLILGIFTGIAAFFGSFMNMNYLLAGTVSINPILFLLELFLILAWRIAGWYGLDRFVLRAFGTPWQPGPMFKK
jgi:thiosulfate dehydrogenase [quinone] large subunit